MKSATIHLQTEEGGEIEIKVLVVPQIAAPIENRIKSVSNFAYLRGLKLAHPMSADDIFEINILIGADYYWDIVEDKIIRGDGPTAVKSKLGYLISGPIAPKGTGSRKHSIMNVMVAHKSEECDLEKFWKIESLGIEPSSDISKEDEFRESYEKSSISYQDNKYFAKLPWKSDHPPLPVNRAVAMRRTENVVNRLRKEPHLLQKYGEIIQEQEDRGFIEKVDAEETTANSKLHYIPHHPVKKDSTTTPIRIVYDCSCRPTTESASLNDCLLDVPPKLNDVTGILMRFRMNRYGVSTDIEKAFLNVGLHPEDRDVTRFFWFSNPTDPKSAITAYRFKSVLFGATCSPFILDSVLSKHLSDNPCDIAEKVKKDLYVDNIVSSFRSRDELSQYFRSARTLFAEGGFNLRSWASNDKGLRILAASEDVSEKSDIVKVLGLRWDTNNDTLAFVKNERLDVNLEHSTKREVLKQSSKIYDPLGILSPVTVRSKMFMQTFWMENLRWDEILPDHMIAEWTEIAKDIQGVTNTVLPRHFFENSSDDNKDAELHVFTDASIKAYGACAYLVSMGQSTLIMAKNRVAPLKSLTIPRLELMAAVIGSRLLDHITRYVDVSRAVLWSDSQIVLSWLKSTKTLKPFIENRVTEIKELTGEFPWRYCPTESNPADLLSRGVSAEKFRGNRLWMEGPQWLTDRDSWPEWKTDDAVILSTITEHGGTERATQNAEDQRTGISRVIDIDRFSTFKRLLRVTAYVNRFIENCKTQEKKTGSLDVREIRTASLIWIRDAQERHYTEVLEDLNSGRRKHNLVKQLKLYKDEEDLIRCEGRIHNAPLEDSAKFPLLIPAKDRLTNLIVSDAHVTHLHAGLSNTIMLLRQTYWIPTIRQVVRSILHKCVVCRKATGRPYQASVPPPLPKDRLREAPPFTVTGVDFTGALNVRNNDGQTSKVYICLFTCASTRAVHLEVVTDLTENTFLLAFRRFASRKSLPEVMISDNASTYTAVAKQIEELTRSSTLTEKLNNYGTTWKFIPKRAPWYGGFWERLIGLAKRSIRTTLGRTLVDLEKLRTIVAEVERILNDRPLTYISSDPLDEPLTPAHLLYGRRISTLPYPGNGHIPNSPGFVNHDTLNNVHCSQQNIINQFWHKWKHEYLTSLREYHRNTGSGSQRIRAGDVVLVHDDLPRTSWTLAIVDKLNTGGDGIARSAVIRTKNGLTSRPVTKLYPLEVPPSEADEEDSSDNDSERLCRKAKREAIEKIKKLRYYVRHEAETHENRRFLSTGMEFAENAYAYVLKAPSRN